MKKIKSLTSILLLLICFNAMAGKMYKWTDKDGSVHFSQTPPINQKKQTSEQVLLKEEKKGDRKCCLAVRKIINSMLIDTAKGRSLADLQSIYSSYNVNLAELENFVSHKTSMDLDYVKISQMGFDTCMNAKFQFCKSGNNSIAAGKAKLKSGSGFFVSQEGHILTNEHVAGTCQNILIEPQGIKAALIDKDSKYDLALLKIDDISQENASFRENAPVLGEQVIAAGFPYKGLLSSGIKITTGIVSALGGIQNDPRVIQVTTPIQPGNSGGPLIDSYGNVIGVIASKLSSTFMLKNYQDVPQNINFAIKAEFVKDFLNQNEIDFNQSDSENKREITTISQSAKDYTVEVTCSND